MTHRTTDPHELQPATAAQPRGRSHLAASGLAVLLLCGRGAASAQANNSATLDVVRQAVAAELNASKVDRSTWTYMDHDVQPGKDAVYHTVETPQGDLRRLIELNGQRLTGADEAKELTRMRSFANSSSEQSHARKDADNDGAQAREFLQMLPTAFLWTEIGQDAEAVRLSFRPNPDFDPPDSQARVLGVMAGQMRVARDGLRIESIRGTLTDDVKFGFGLLGKIDKGGTFNVERRQIVPGFWQITETHVHIGGHALLFKTIGQQEDDVKTDWHRSTAPNLQVALEELTR